MMKKKRIPWIQCTLFALICIGVYFGAGESDQSSKEENLKQLEERLQQVVIQCFSIEGEYPQDLQYLKENYKIYIDEDLYQVNYLYQGANIKPQILVMRKDTLYEK